MRLPVLFGAILLAAATAGAQEPGAGPRLVVEPSAFDFGNSLPGKTLEKQFVLRNVGSADLVIESVDPTCGCTITEGWSKVVKAGGKTTLRVSLKTPTSPGRTEKSVFIRTNDKTPVELKVATTVVAPPAASPH